MKYVNVTRVANGPEQDPNSSSWNWKAGVVHIGVFSEYQTIDPPKTVCGLPIVIQKTTRYGTPSGFQWCAGAASTNICDDCDALKGSITIDHAATVHIPEWDERKPW